LTSRFLHPSATTTSRDHGTPSSAPGRICRLGPEDGGDCLLLDRLALGGLWSAEQWDRELSEARRPVLGWRQGNLLLALASSWLVLDELQITAVAVHPEHRRRGLARQLLEALLLLGREAGAERATLEVAHTNAAAQALYAGLGFKAIAVRRGYYRNGDDALVHWTKL
jgi:ribosomal-protein-alanine N-acetyltransferase